MEVNSLVNKFKNLKLIQLYRYYFSSDYIALHALIDKSFPQLLGPAFVMLFLAYVLEVNSIIMILVLTHFLMTVIALIDGGVGAATHVVRQIKREQNDKLIWYTRKMLDLERELRAKEMIIESLRAQQAGTNNQQRANTNNQQRTYNHYGQQQQARNPVTDRIRSYYTVLGINPTLDINEVKKAYRMKAKIHHPDKGGNKTEFVKVQRAYEEIKKALEAVGR